MFFLLLIRLLQHLIRLWTLLSHVLQFQCLRKFTQLLDFVIPFIQIVLHHFYLLFIAFLTFYHIEKLFFIHFGNKPWLRNFILCIRLILRIWYLYHLIRVSLVLVVFIKSKLSLMVPLSSTKPNWLLRFSTVCYGLWGGFCSYYKYDYYSYSYCGFFSSSMAYVLVRC